MGSAQGLFKHIGEKAREGNERQQKMFGEVQGKINQVAGDISDRFHNAAADLQKTGSDFVNQAGEKIREMQGQAGNMLNGAHQKIHEFGDELKHKVGDAVNAGKQNFEDARAGLEGKAHELQGKLSGAHISV